MIFKEFQTTDIVTGRIQTVTSGLWSDGGFELNEFYTSSWQTQITGSSNFEVKNGLYYYDIYNQPPTGSTEATAEVQFSVTYGHVDGSGSIVDWNQGATFPTKTVYSEFKNMLLNPSDEVFTVTKSGSLDGVDISSMYVITFAAHLMKDRVSAGVVELHLSGSRGSFSFIDDSSLMGTTNTGNVFNIVSGSIENGITTIASQYDVSGSGFGLFYPNLGIVILNPSAISNVVGTDLLDNQTTSSYALNHAKLYNAIKGGAKFIARDVEYIPTRHYFVRVGNQEYNYSNNPSYIIMNPTNSLDNGRIRFSEFYNDPKVYITSIGLYDSSNNLVAVAKLSQPTLKTFDSEILCRVRVDV